MAFDISKFVADFSVPDSGTEVREIPLSKLCGNPANFYPPVPAEELEALADSIAANGLLEPLLVVDAGGVYKLISGHNRLRALQALNAHGGAYRTALCRVLPRMDPAHELTAIIESNRQRKKSPALLAKEAEKLTEAYAKRKAAGEELPGRIRDRVAADLGVSATKLGNLSAIKRGLHAPELLDAWEAGALPEAVALELARLDPAEQRDFTAWVAEDSARGYTGPDLDRFLARWDDVEEDEPEAPAPELEMGFRDREEIARSIAPEDEAEAERHVFRVLPPEPEGQMVLAGWMPGGVDPGEPGEFVVLVDLGGDGYYRAFMAWDGSAWEMLPSHQRPELPVGWWLRLPPVPGEEEI